MYQVNRQQPCLEQRRRLALGQIGQAEVRERNASHLDLLRKSGHRFRPVVPETPEHVPRAGRPRVGVAHESKPACNAVFDQARERAGLVGACGKLPVAELDRPEVVCSKAPGIGVGEVKRPVGDLDQRRRVVHDRRPAVRARREIVFEPEGMPDLVGRELTQPRERDFGGLRAVAGGQQVFGPHVVALVVAGPCAEPSVDQQVLPDAK